jgi:predicted AlkP superfamily phosphohydrolase/phosphomutase
MYKLLVYGFEWKSSFINCHIKQSKWLVAICYISIRRESTVKYVLQGINGRTMGAWRADCSKMVKLGEQWKYIYVCMYVCNTKVKILFILTVG